MAETLQRAAVIDPLVHAYVAVDAERAMAEARRRLQDIAAGRPLGPLHGVPFAVKDMIDVRGQPTMCRSQVPPGQAALADAAVVKRLRRAGAILIGKLAMEEFGIGSDDEETRWPPALNPWDLRYTAGGSSSGCAAAVAAGLVPLAVGTDTGGSSRCPAAMCGVVGLKPTSRRISTAGVFPLAPSLDHLGLITRTVEDCALAFQVAAGPGRAVRAEPAPIPHADRRFPLRGLTIGVVRHFFSRDLPAPATVTEAIDAAVGVLAGLGARIVEVEIEPAQVYETCGSTIQHFEAYAVHRAWLRSHADRYGDTARTALMTGATITRPAYDRARLLRHHLRRDFTARIRHTGARVLVTAVTPGTPWRVGDREARRTAGDYSMRIAFNVLGVPAMAVPIGRTGAGLPLSMQLIASADDEPAIFTVGEAYQDATIWHHLTPTVSRPACDPPTAPGV